MNLIYQLFIKHGFILEFFICIAMFTYRLKRRKHFVLRIALTLLMFIISSILWNLQLKDAFISLVLRYTFYFGMATIAIIFCFDITKINAIFCAIGGYTSQHCAFRIGSLFQTLFKFLPIFALDAIYVTTVVVCYAVIYFAVVKKIMEHGKEIYESKQIILLSIILLIFTTILGPKYIIDVAKMDVLAIIMMEIYDIICSIFSLCFLSGMFKQAQLEEDIKIIDQIIYMQNKQMKMSKENIDLINIKCHDLKHHLNALEAKLTKEEIENLKNTINIYDMSLKTGDEVLDTVLIEKSLLCEKEHIKLECMADGKYLKMLTSSEIYSLFGNAIDNAIEAVSQIEDVEKKIINIKVFESIGLLSINFSNYYVSNVALTDGTPVSTKSQNGFHGFGLKSIKLITEKYNGYINIDTSDNVFNLCIVLPLKQNVTRRAVE